MEPSTRSLMIFLFSIFLFFGFVSCAPFAQQQDTIDRAAVDSTNTQQTTTGNTQTAVNTTPKIADDSKDQPTPNANDPAASGLVPPSEDGNGLPTLNTHRRTFQRHHQRTTTDTDIPSEEEDGSSGPGLAKLEGPPSTMGSGTYPRATLLEDGSLLGTFSTSSGSSRAIVTVTSTDSGSTWSPLGEVICAPSASSDIDNPFLLQLPCGAILAAYRNHKKSEDKYQRYKLDVSRSTDGGATFKYLSTLADMKAEGDGDRGGNWEPFLRIAADGSLQGYYSHTNNRGEPG
ncbi:MAG: hypothetical protein M1831_002532 [Alyxoria varia]|nr:MAG: hypothetical protein M1831_002532 [Alyxoria varia]